MNFLIVGHWLSTVGDFVMCLWENKKKVNLSKKKKIAEDLLK